MKKLLQTGTEKTEPDESLIMSEEEGEEHLGEENDDSLENFTRGNELCQNLIANTATFMETEKMSPNDFFDRGRLITFNNEKFLEGELEKMHKNIKGYDIDNLDNYISILKEAIECQKTKIETLRKSLG